MKFEDMRYRYNLFPLVKYRFIKYFNCYLLFTR